MQLTLEIVVGLILTFEVQPWLACLCPTKSHGHNMDGILVHRVLSCNIVGKWISRQFHDWLPGAYSCPLVWVA